jgi:hypothetical protein
MSIKRLSADERATYLVGLAVRRQLLDSPRDQENLARIATVLNWVEHWLSPDELHEVRLSTGFIFDQDVEDELARVMELARRSRGGTPPDDIPF